MRSKVQGVKRYFTAVWSVFASVVVLTVVAGATVDTAPLDLGIAVVAGVLSIVGGVIGFVHGATVMHAKQCDDDDLNSLEDQEE